MKIYIVGNINSAHMPGIKAMYKHAELHIKTFGHDPVNPIVALKEDLSIDKRMVLLDTCEAIYILPDWMDNTFARREVKHALDMEMAIINEHNIKPFLNNQIN